MDEQRSPHLVPSLHRTNRSHGALEAGAAANLVLEPNAFLVWDLKNLREERVQISTCHLCVSVTWARREAATHMAWGRVDQLDGTGPGLDDCIMARKGP
jgi:hypothetical protein